MYSSTLSLTSALEKGGWSTPRPGHFTLMKETRYTLYMRLCEPQGRSGRVQITLRPPVFDPRTVQPVSSLYTDDTIPAHIILSIIIIIISELLLACSRTSDTVSLLDIC